VAAARADFFEMPKENSVQAHGITSQKAVVFIGNTLVIIPNLTSDLAVICCSVPFFLC